MARLIESSIASNRKAAQDGYALLRDCADIALVGLIGALETSHMSTLDTLEAQSQLLTTIDLTYRARLERQEPRA